MPEKPLSFMELIELTHSFGLTLLQIGDNLPLHKLSPEALCEGKEALQKYGIDLEIGCRGLLEKTLETYLQLCIYFSAKLLRIVIDVEQYEPTDEEITKILRKWVPEFEKNKVVLAIENHDRFKAYHMVTILKEFHSEYVGICLDTANSLGCLEGVETVTQSLIPYTVNLHAKDIHIQRLPSQLGFQVTGSASGEGMLNMRALLQQVYLQNESVNCILEQWTGYTGNLADTIQKESEEAKKGVQNLKKLIAEITASNGVLESTEKVKTYDGCAVERIKVNGTEMYGLVLETLSGNDALLSSVRKACEEYPIAQFHVRDKVEEYLFERQGLERQIGEQLIFLKNNLKDMDTIIFTIGRSRPVIQHNSLKYIKEMEANYFSNLAELIDLCRREKLRVGFYILKDGFIDDITIFVQALGHYNAGNYIIYF
ncbi:MAG: TIM barrel protein [Lachnospiraceae bacterium]|nr:TIM barrel protein [Lachnospiraceae bacterium]